MTTRIIEFLALDLWLSASRRRMIWTGVAGLTAIAIGIAANVVFSQRISDRRDGGVLVEAVVTDIDHIPTGRIGRKERVHVTYVFSGRRYSTALMATWTEGRNARGSRILLYVDAEDPRLVASEEGLASEGYWMLVPMAAVGLGVVILIVLSAAAVRWILRERSWRVPREGTSPLGISGVVHAVPRFNAWREAVAELGVRAQTVGRGVESPLNLQLVFQVPHDIVEPEVNGVRIGMYWRKRRTLTVYASPRDPDSDPGLAIRELLADALNVAEKFAQRKNIAKDLFMLREVAAALQRQVPDLHSSS